MVGRALPPGCTTQRTRESPSWRKRQRKRLKPSCECQPTSPGDHQPFRHNRRPRPKLPPPSPPPSSLQPPLFTSATRTTTRVTSHPTGSCSQLPPAYLGLDQETVTNQPLPRISGISPGGARGIGAARSLWHLFLFHPFLHPPLRQQNRDWTARRWFLNQREGGGCILVHITFEVHCLSRLGTTTQGVHCHQGPEFHSWTRARLHLQRHIAQKAVTPFSFSPFASPTAAPAKQGLDSQKVILNQREGRRVHLGHITFEVHWSSRLGSTTQGVHCHQRRSLIPEARRTKVHLGHNTWRCTVLLAWVLQDGEFTVTNNWVSFLTKSLDYICNVTSHRRLWLFLSHLFSFFFTQPLRQQPRDWPARRWLSTTEKDEGASWAQHLWGALLFSPGYYNTGSSPSPKITFHSLSYSLIARATSHRTEGCDAFLPLTFSLSLTAAPQRKKTVGNQSCCSLGTFVCHLGRFVGDQKKKQKTLTTHSATGAVITDLGRASRSGLVTLYSVPPPAVTNPNKPSKIASFGRASRSGLVALHSVPPPQSTIHPLTRTEGKTTTTLDNALGDGCCYHRP